MGSIIYDFLSESILFSEANQNDNYSSVSESDLLQELERYRVHAIENINDLGEEISSYKSQLKVFGSTGYFSIPHLMQTALYLDQVILDDPVFPFTVKRSDISNSMGEMIGVTPIAGIDRPALAIAAKKMKDLTPMVAANYIKFFPVSYYMEINEQIPFSYSKSGYSDVLPPNILSKYNEYAEVRSLMQTNQGVIVKNSLEVGRGISVQFKGDNDEVANIYHLHEQEVVALDDETQIAHFKLSLPDTPPSVELFKAWVNQSINQSAIGHYECLLKGMALSHRLGASYLTGSEFTHSLLGSNSSNIDPKSYTSDCVLNLELPFLDKVSIHDLMSVRMNDGEAFELFRKDLESKLCELRTETDQEKLNIEIQNIIHEFNEVQMIKLDQKIKSLRSKSFNQAFIAAGGLIGSVASGGYSLAATMVALANGANTYVEHKGAMRENPAYFLWKVKNRS